MKLGFKDGWIYAYGRINEVADLSRSGAHVFNSETVALPATRLNFMCAEAVSVITATSEDYNIARSQIMDIPNTIIETIKTILSNAHLDPDQFARHQLQSIAIGSSRSGFFNGSEQGTGKTRAALATIKAVGAFRTLIACPKSLVGEWIAEAERINMNVNIIDIGTGSSAERRDLLMTTEHGFTPTIVIINYEMANKLKLELFDFHPNMLILDESWRLKDPQTLAYKAILPIARQASFRLALTGTAIGNHVGDLYSQLTLIDPTLRLGSAHDFLEAFGEIGTIYRRGIDGPTQMMKIIGAKNVPMLMSIIEPLWFRATKTSCLDLPEKVPSVRVKFVLPRSVRELYDRVAVDGDLALGSLLSLSGERVTMLRLQQIVGGHKPIVSDDPEEDTRLEELPSYKIDWLKHFAADRLLEYPNIRCIIWCKFTAEIIRLQRELSAILRAEKVVIATGNTSNSDLDNIKLSFNSRDENGVQVIVAQIKKLACGHNLQACDWNIYYSHSWSYLERSQSEDRSHRMGRIGPVQYIDLVCENTIDEPVLQATDNKRDLAIRLSPGTVKRKGNNSPNSN